MLPANPSIRPLHRFLLAPAPTPTQFRPQPNDVPALHLFSILPAITLLSLRLVSRTCLTRIEQLLPEKICFSHALVGLDSLQPDQCKRPGSLPILACICIARSLQIRITSSALDVSKPRFSLLDVLSPNLEHLHISLPPVSKDREANANAKSSSLLNNNGCFHHLLTIRYALQIAYLPNLKTITIENLTLMGIMALRWTPLASFRPSTIIKQDDERIARSFWSSITTLSISLIPWWDTNLSLGQNQKALGDESKRDQYRDGIKILNDWLFSFSSTLITLSFSWKLLLPLANNSHLPNPLLLDLFSTPPLCSSCSTSPDIYSKPTEVWYSAPPIKWRRLRSVVLGAGITTISLQDKLEMNRRAYYGLDELTIGGNIINRTRLSALKTLRDQELVGKIPPLIVNTEFVPGKIIKSTTFDDTKTTVANARRTMDEAKQDSISSTTNLFPRRISKSTTFDDSKSSLATARRRMSCIDEEED